MTTTELREAYQTELALETMVNYDVHFDCQ